MANPNRRSFERMALWPVPKVILTMALPSIVSMLVQSVYSMADTYFVGQLPLIAKEATAAVTLVGPLFIVVQAVGLAFGLGGSSYISRLLGEGKAEEAKRVLTTCMYTGFLMCLLLLFVGEAMMTPLVRFLGATDTALPLAVEYASVMILGAPVMAICFVLNSGLRAEGNAVLSTVGMVSGSLLNIALDPICINVLGWGVRGAAIATVFSQLVSLAILLSFYLRGRSHLSIAPRYFAPERGLYAQVLKIGVPTFLRNILGAVSAILVNYAARDYGDAAIAGLGIVGRFSWVIFSVLLGFSMAYMPVSGFNYGARRYGRVREAYRFALRVGVVFMTLSGLAMLIFSTAVASALHSDPLVSEIGAKVMRAQALTYPLVGWGLLINMLFESLGRGMQATILSLGRQGLFLTASILILPRIFGFDGIIAAQPAADVLFFCLALPLSASMLRELKALRDDPVPLEFEDAIPDSLAADPNPVG